MSHIVFGIFSVSEFNQIDLLKQQLNSIGIILHINDFDFYKDIDVMLNENNAIDAIRFCLTTQTQPCNSEDLLIPSFDSNDDNLCCKTDNRTEFNQMCLNNLNVLKHALNFIINNSYVSNVKVFITEGYDDDFDLKECTIDDMIKDIYLQVINHLSVDSTIYTVK